MQIPNFRFQIPNSKFQVSGFRFQVLDFKFSIFAVCLLIFALSLKVDAQIETPPAPAQPRSAQIPTPVERILPNGLRVIVVQRKNVPLVTAMLMIKSGGEVDPEGLAGVTDMTAELLTKGTKTRTASQIAEQMEFLGGSIESGAAWDFSSVTWRVTSDKLDKAMSIAADTVRHPIFSPEEIDRYKTQALDELSVSLKQPGSIAGYVVNRVVFGDEPYGHPLNGTPESIQKIKQKDLNLLHRSYYVPQNAILVIAGDIVPAAALTMVRKHFGAWKKGGLKTPPLIPKIRSVGNSSRVEIEKITVVDLPDAGQAAVAVAQKTDATLEDDFYFPALVTNSVLGGGYSARLNQEIRIKRGLSYGARSDLPQRGDYSVFLTRTQTKNESAAEVADIIVKELDRLANENIAETELTPRKAVLIGDFSRDLETTNGLVERLGQLALYGVDLKEINGYIQSVEKVTDKNSKDFVRDLYGFTFANVIIVGDSKKFADDLQKRFPTIKVEVIPIAELDLNTPTLRKDTAQR